MATSGSKQQTVTRLLLVIAAALALVGILTYYNRARAPERFTAGNLRALDAAEAAPGGYAVPREQMQSIDAAQGGGWGPAEALGTEQHRPLSMPDGGAPLPKAPFPKDSLTPEDLLPKDAANSAWAQANPAGMGDVKDQNFLTAGYHIGVNTTGQSLRNANMQLRSEPPNPQFRVSIWQQSTIDPDLARRPLE